MLTNQIYLFQSILLNPSAMAHKDSKWPKMEAAIAIKKEDSARLCELFNIGEWKKLNKSVFFDVKYYNPENIIFQHMCVKVQVFNATKKVGISESFLQWLHKTAFDIG